MFNISVETRIKMTEKMPEKKSLVTSVITHTYKMIFCKAIEFIVLLPRGTLNMGHTPALGVVKVPAHFDNYLKDLDYHGKLIKFINYKTA